jgi:gliding motility-associated-like protein
MPNPIVELADVIVCVNAANQWVSNPTLQTNLSSSLYTFKWYYNSTLLPNTTSSLVPTQFGTYKVIVTISSTGCTTEDSATVTTSSPITAIAAVLEDFTSDQTILVEAIGGSPPYFYSINGETPQTSNVFQVDAGGKYYITVTDQSICNSVVVCACVFMYEKYFTPNGDGFNDTWNIKVPDQTKVMQISITDRFGKLIKRYNPEIDRWDGTYNGEKLFSTDYWFVVDYENCTGEFKQYKSHFALKR